MERIRDFLNYALYKSTFTLTFTFTFVYVDCSDRSSCMSFISSTEVMWENVPHK